MIKEIKLTQGRVALIDEEDWELVNKHNWCVQKTKHHLYAVNTLKKRIYLHRLITNCPIDKIIDHIDGNGLNNCKSNLRICTRTQNSQNYRKPITNTSGYKGVHFNKTDKLWIAYIRTDGKKKYLGCFKTKEEAYKKYCEAAELYHKEFKNLG